MVLLVDENEEPTGTSDRGDRVRTRMIEFVLVAFKIIFVQIEARRNQALHTYERVRMAPYKPIQAHTPRHATPRHPTTALRLTPDNQSDGTTYM
mmetsp:Transcript_20157/g.56154  ORF Transcript_20157/g.56154 Transcript_20157/m.56154 type:complete len:94 (+) Transcript_20157:102-383(+)